MTALHRLVLIDNSRSRSLSRGIDLLITYYININSIFSYKGYTCIALLSSVTSMTEICKSKHIIILRCTKFKINSAFTFKFK